MIEKKQITIITSLIAIALLATTQWSMADKGIPKLSDKNILSALIKNQDVLLQSAKHCNGVGTADSDKTIGDYISGFWVLHTDKVGSNWLDINVSKSSATLFLAKVMIYRKNREENWGWGVSFKLDNKAKVQRDSFTCLGSG